MFTTSKNLHRISLDTDDQTDVVIPVRGLVRTVSLDWDSARDYIYWADLATNTISRARWDGTGQEVNG